MDATMRSLKHLRRDDSGLALFVVVAMSMILFVLASTVILLAEYRTVQSTAKARQSRVLQVAEAGLNDYIYRMSNDYYYYDTGGGNARVLTGAVEGGTYVVTPEMPEPGQTWVKLNSVGTLEDGKVRRVSAVVGFPSFADYVMMADAGFTVGSQSVIWGPVRTNGSLTITGGGTSFISGTQTLKKGAITGDATAYGTISLSTGVMSEHVGGQVIAGNSKNTTVKKVPFASVTNDVASMRSGAGLKLASSRTIDSLTTGAWGYRMELSGTQVKVTRIIGMDASTTTTANWGKPIVDARTATQQTYAIPANGVIFVEGDNVWVSGDYNAKVTICATGLTSTDTKYGNIFLQNSIRATNPASTMTAGLLAQNCVLVPAWYSKSGTTPVMESTLTVQSAMLAQNGQIKDSLQTNCSGGYTGASTVPGTNSQTGATWTPPVYTHNLEITGSMSSFLVPGFNADYVPVRVYKFDPRLKDSPPPSWPRIRDSLKVMDWHEY